MKRVKFFEAGDPRGEHSTAYAGRWAVDPVPTHTLPERGLSGEVAYRIVKDELALDARPALNLASFVTTWMDEHADRLAHDVIDDNFIDHDEYPQLEAIHERIISMTAHLFNAPANREPTGTVTVGSSEAIMLGLLAHKWSWREARLEKGLPVDRPNIVFGADVHTCWEKFADYFDVERRVVPLREGRYTLDLDAARGLIDENTIAVGAVVGTTFTGQVDDVAGIDRMLREVKRERGWDIPIHVDAASGGFVLPFTDPERAWDFRLEQVRSINVSNHKFGLVYPGLGTVVFRDSSVVPKKLVYDIGYLGGSMKNYSLNFSRGSQGIALQYYNFLRLGREGYARVMSNVVRNARHLSDMLEKTGPFEALQDRSLPVVVVRARPDHPLDLHHLSALLRSRGWVVPAYALPLGKDYETQPEPRIDVLRMVVRENVTRDMVDTLLHHFDEALTEMGEGAPAHHRPVKRHRPC